MAGEPPETAAILPRCELSSLRPLHRSERSRRTTTTPPGRLTELVSVGGEFIPTTRYEEMRLEREAQGNHWPNAGVLSSSSGHWLIAVKAANRFWFGGGSERATDNHAHAKGTKPGYRPTEIAAALREAKIELELPDDLWPPNGSTRSGPRSSGDWRVDPAPTDHLRRAAKARPLSAGSGPATRASSRSAWRSALTTRRCAQRTGITDDSTRLSSVDLTNRPSAEPLSTCDS
jgi:hypothetical protein